jgi:hypothetical protein
MAELMYENLNRDLEKALVDYMFGPIWDGNVNSKHQRDQLYDLGLIHRGCGFQWINACGIEYLNERGIINQDTWRKNPFVSRKV